MTAETEGPVRVRVGVTTRYVIR